MVKKLIVGILLLLALLAIGVVLLGSNLDSIIKGAVEKYGSEATQAEVTLKSVHISPTDGSGMLEDFTLGNPEGFHTDSAMKVGKISVKIDAKSLMGTGPIIIRDILIDAPEVTYEVASKGETNLGKIQKNVEAFAASLTGGKKTEVAKEELVPVKTESAAQTRKIIIKRLVVHNGQVRLSHELLKGNDLVKTKLPTLDIKNIGDAKDGTTPAEVARVVLGKISAAAIEVGQADLVKRLRQQGLDSLKGAVEESDLGKGVGKALDGLFGK